MVCGVLSPDETAKRSEGCLAVESPGGTHTDDPPADPTDPGGDNKEEEDPDAGVDWWAV